MNLNTLKSEIIARELTMLSENVLEHFRDCIEEVHFNGVRGDIIETGVWRGGACIYAHHVLKLLNSHRRLFMADSFEGLPRPKSYQFPADDGDPHWKMPHFRVSLTEVIENFQRFGKIDESLAFVQGWFSDTIPKLDIGPISVLRLDGDMYESTIVVLEHLYPKLSPGGFCIIDDYGHKRARQAVTDYRADRGITDEIIRIDPDPETYPSSYWKKT